MINKVLNLYRKNNIIRNIAKENRLFLQNGYYKISGNFSTIYNVNYSNIKTFYTKKEENMSAIKKIILNLFYNKKIHIKTEKKIFNGDCLILSSSADQVKIFDQSNEYILTKYLKDNKYKKMKSNILCMSELYNYPTILKFDDENRSIIEKFISNQDNSSIESKYKKILDVYINGAFVAINEKVNKNWKNINNNVYINLLKDVKDFNVKINFIKSHGDLWNGNIIFNNSKLYIIDFEEIGYYPFYYDLLYYILSDAYIDNNFELIDMFFTGLFDKEFSDIFKKNNIEYDSNKKEIYLKAFIIEYINNRWKNLKQDAINKEFVKIEKLIKYIENKGDN